MARPPILDTDQSYGLIVLQPGKVQQVLFKSIVMNLNYRYGLTILKSSNINEAAGVLRANSASFVLCSSFRSKKSRTRCSCTP